MPRLVRIAGPAFLLVAALLSLLIALQIGGAAKAPLIFDPGPVVRFGLPLVTMLVNIGVAGTIGALVLTLFALIDREPEPAIVRVVDAVARWFEQARIASVELRLGQRSYKLAQWVRVDS